MLWSFVVIWILGNLYSIVCKSMDRNCLVKVMFSARISLYHICHVTYVCLFVRLFVAVSGCLSGIKSEFVMKADLPFCHLLQSIEPAVPRSHPGGESDRPTPPGDIYNMSTYTCGSRF